MAKKVETFEERVERIYKVRDYVLDKIAKNEKISTRSIANYFTENEFAISNYTVDLYVNKLENLDKNSYEIIKEFLENNKPKTIDDNSVKIRVLEATKLLLKDFTVEEIAKKLNSTPATIYRDLVVRLPKVETNEALLNDVANTLTRHSLENIQPNQKNK